MVPQSVYIKKLAEENGYTTWLVDGAKVRKLLDENFVEYDYHGHFRFIPEKEFWIDNEMPTEEYPVYQARLQREAGYVEQGMGVVEAATMADAYETAVRQNGSRVKRLLGLQNQEVLRDRIRKKRWEEVSDVVSVWLVDGDLVRSTYYLGFAEGGHDVVYPWVPKNEIWIEESLTLEEREFIILHELHERFLMLSEKMSYEDAHHGATIVEDRYRENRDGLAARIREEIQKNNVLSGA